MDNTFQLDLLKAQNESLTKSEHIYRLVCESSDYGFIYQSLDSDDLLTFGSFENMFGMKLYRVKDLDVLLEDLNSTHGSAFIS